MLYPLDKALAAAVLGTDANIVFEGARVRLMKQGYQPRLSGWICRLFTGMVKRAMKIEIGWPQPGESIKILEELGANFGFVAPR